MMWSRQSKKIAERAWLVVFVLIYASSLVGCYGTVLPRWEDNRYPVQDLSLDDLIHIPEGFVPVVAVNGLMQVSYSDNDGTEESKIETRENDPHLKILLVSLADTLRLNSGIEARVATELATGFFDPGRAGLSVNYNNVPLGNQPFELPDDIPLIDSVRMLIDARFTHLVLVHVHIVKDPIKPGIFVVSTGFGFTTERNYRFEVNASMYDLSNRRSAASLQLNDAGNSAALWSVLAYPVAINAVDVKRYMEAIGKRMGEEFSRRWVVDKTDVELEHN